MDANIVRNVVFEKLHEHVHRVATGNSDDIDILPAVFHEVLTGVDQVKVNLHDVKVDLLADQKLLHAHLDEVSAQIRTDLGRVETKNRLGAETNKNLLIIILLLTLLNSAGFLWLLVK